MTLDQLIAQLEVVRNEHGGQVEVVARRFGDYLESGPILHVTQWLRPPATAHRASIWSDPDDYFPGTPAALVETVVFVEH